MNYFKRNYIQGTTRLGASALLLRAVCLLWVLFLCQAVQGQGRLRDLGEGAMRSLDRSGRPMGAASQMRGGDSLQHRDVNEDSITIFYRYFDSTRILRIDSSVNDYTKRFPLPAAYLYLGNLGSPAHSLVFSPNLRPGFDAGFHGYDIYRYNLTDTRFFQTTRPYTELDYLLGSKSEQTIKVLHTQNITPVWNVVFDYRFLNTPGHFKNSNAIHSNIRLNSSFSTKDRHYSGVAVFIANRNRASENGGLRNDSFLVAQNPAYADRFNIPTWLGGDGDYSANFFASTINTGMEYKSKQFYFRHQYDIGPSDSSYAEDSAIVRTFYPRLRLQHSLSYTSASYNFHDNLTSEPDVAQVYQDRYGITITDVPMSMQDNWKDFTNEGAVIFFPQKNNQDQFLKTGAGYQFLQGRFGKAAENFSNIYLQGEYRNRTRNRKWDMLLNGRLYMTGLNAGDYQAAASLQTDLGARLGSLRLGFQNINRTPSFVFDSRSSFILSGSSSFNQENWTVLSGDLYINRLNLHLLGNYYLISNYTYWNNYHQASQEATLQNLLHLGAEKKTKLSRRWFWYAELHLQQASGGSINLPHLYSRNRLAYEASFFKKLNLSTGIELRYFTPYKADDWSPFNGQWVVQNKETINNRPDISLFMHMRIRGFRLFLRADNMNTLQLNPPGFLHNNFAAPHYPTPGYIFRTGIYWSFVN